MVQAVLETHKKQSHEVLSTQADMYKWTVVYSLGLRLLRVEWGLGEI